MSLRPELLKGGYMGTTIGVIKGDISLDYDSYVETSEKGNPVL